MSSGTVTTLAGAEVPLEAGGRDAHVAVEPDHEGEPTNATVDPGRGDAQARGGLAHVQEVVLARIARGGFRGRQKPGRELRLRAGELDEERRDLAPLDLLGPAGVTEELSEGRHHAGEFSSEPARCPLPSTRSGIS